MFIFIVEVLWTYLCGTRPPVWWMWTPSSSGSPPRSRPSGDTFSQTAFLLEGHFPRLFLSSERNWGHFSWPFPYFYESERKFSFVLLHFNHRGDYPDCFFQKQLPSFETFCHKTWKGPIRNVNSHTRGRGRGGCSPLKVHKIEICFAFDFEICNISLLVNQKIKI